MKLLFDQHISFRGVRALSDVFPDARHVRFFKLEYASDGAIWDFARAEGYTIVTKDGDFHQRSILLGHPPKVVWLKHGNSDRAELEAFLRNCSVEISGFVLNEHASLLILRHAGV